MNYEAVRNFWHPVAYSYEVTSTPRATRLLGEPLALYRSNGVATCFKDLCIHRGTALSRGSVAEDGCLVCPYHGWRYDASGQCTRIPQQPPELPIPRKARAVAYPCTERYGIVWASLGAPTEDIAEFPEFDREGYRCVPCGPFTWRTSAARQIENFTDFGHFAWVHDGTLGDSRYPLVTPEPVSRVGNELHYCNTTLAVARPDIKESELSTSRLTYRLTMPFSIHFTSQRGASGANFVMYCATQPISAAECRAYVYSVRNWDLSAPDAPYRAFQDLVFGQDQPNVESQRPEQLPVDLSAELHLRFDRVAVEYRRWLGELGVEPQPGDLYSD